MACPCQPPRGATHASVMGVARLNGPERCPINQDSCGYDVKVACQLPKLDVRVRFPLPAPASLASHETRHLQHPICRRTRRARGHHAHRRRRARRRCDRAPRGRAQLRPRRAARPAGRARSLAARILLGLRARLRHRRKRGCGRRQGAEPAPPARRHAALQDADPLMPAAGPAQARLCGQVQHADGRDRGRDRRCARPLAGLLPCISAIWTAASARSRSIHYSLW